MVIPNQSNKENNGNDGKWCLSGDCLPSDIATLGKEGMIKESREWMNNWDEEDISKNRNRVLLCGVDRSRDSQAFSTANDKASSQTVARYGSLWKNLRDFSLIIGDYKTAIICDQSKDTLCSYRPESANVDTCIHFMRFNVCDDSMLLHYQTHEIILDVKRRPIQCMNNWKVEKTLHVYKMALNKLHNHFSEEIGKHYHERCPKCCQLKDKCDQHLDYPRFFRRGNPTSNQRFLKQYELMQEKLREEDNDRKTGSFIPSELREIREYCLSHNNKYYLMLWTIMIVGVKEFLRIDEVLNLKVEHFKKDLFIVNEKNVEALAISVKGKTDLTAKDLLMWDESDEGYKFTELSPTRAILMWIKVSKIEKGYIFPSKTELAEGCQSPANHLPYSTYLDFIKSLFKGKKGRPGILSKDHDPKTLYGTHILRKTGYLLAIWGSRDCSSNIRHSSIGLSARNKMSSITDSARHCDNTAYLHTYIRDAETIYEALRSCTNDDWKKRNEVGNWRSIHIINHDYFINGNKGQKHYQLPISQLANYYFSKLIGLSDEYWQDPISITRLHRLLDAFKPSSTEQNSELKQYPQLHNSFQDLECMLSATLPEKDKERAAMLLERVKADSLAHKRLVNNHYSGKNDSSKRFHSATTLEAKTASKRSKNTKLVDENKFITFDKDYRSLTKQCKTKEEEMHLMLTAVKSVVRQKRDKKVFRDQAMKCWIHKIAKPCLCALSCYNENVNDFLKAHPGFVYSMHNCIKNQTHNEPLKAIEELVC